MGDVGEDAGGTPIEELVGPAERVDGPDVDAVALGSKGLNLLPGQAGVLWMNVVGSHDLKRTPPVV